MAQKVVTQLIDDLDGKELAPDKGETVVFALDGVSYEIDLSLKNADAFRGVFQDYIAAGRKVARSTRSSGASRAQSGPSAKEVREWGRANGLEVPDRGRIPADVRQAYDAAN